MGAHRFVSGARSEDEFVEGVEPQAIDLRFVRHDRLAHGCMQATPCGHRLLISRPFTGNQGGVGHLPGQKAKLVCSTDMICYKVAWDLVWVPTLLVLWGEGLA